ncbi:hypothetical protein QN354_02175 [Cryobacterium sp. 5I3]|uniref:hypothetical protein n=1 Tax=Cryobacterium sp. 5I3 TaxID=3048592 RepID=UPI002B22DFEB|nr:hypothetical protein [Cryobacterium sp. 5I3]MEB0200561.1 hypothetical protein [Cryobacterium sp. 5I3]
MGTTVKDLLINILADNSKASKTFDDTGAKVDKMSKGISVGSTAVLGAAVAGATAAVAAGMAVDGAYDTIAQRTGVTGDVLTGLEESFQNVAKTVPESLDAVGSTVAGLNARTGLTGSTLETLSSQVIRLGTFAGQGEIDINGLTSATTLFKVPGDQMSGTLDTLYGISQKTGVSVNDLTSGLGSSGAALQLLGFSLGDSAQMIGTLNKAGIDSDKVTAAMGKGLVALAKAGEEPQAAFKRVVGEIGGFIKAGDQAGAIDLASKVFGAKGAPQFITALQSGALNIDTLTGSADAAGASILDMAETTDDFPEKWGKLQNTAQLALADIGGKLIPVITDGFDKLMPIVTWAADNTGVVIGLGGALVAGALAVKGFEAVNAVSSALSIFKGVTIASTGATIANTGATIANSLAWLASPVTWIVIGIIAAIAGLVLAGIWLVQNWDGVSKWFGEMWSGMWAGIQWFFGVVAEGFLNFTPLGIIIKNWGAITDWLGGWWGGIIGMASDNVHWIGSKVDEFVSFFTSIPTRVGNAWTGMGNMVHDVMRNVTRYAAEAWNNTLGSLNVDLPSYLGGAHIQFPKLVVPALASGGIVSSPTLALIGEAGPEAVVPLSQYRGGGGDDPGAEYYVDVPVEVNFDGETMVRKIERVILKRR